MPKNPLSFKKHNYNNLQLLMLAAPCLILILLFCYIPLSGLVVVFKDYSFMDGIYGSPWAGLKNFEFFFYNMDKAWRATRNTLFLNFLCIVTGTIASIIIALFFNEINRKYFKKLTQSLTIFPYFLSWIIVGGILTTFIDFDKGLINQLVFTWTGNRIDFLNQDKYWPAIISACNIWKNAGYNSIIYTATITGLDPGMYESAELDGATTFKKMWYITVPLLKPTVVLLTLLSVGRIFYGDLTMMMGLTNLNPMLIGTTEIIDTFVYRSMTKSGDFAMSSAVGLYQSIFGFILVTASNFIAGKFDKEYKIF